MNRAKRRILIAEDNVALSRVVQFNLQKVGYDAVVAQNGLLAWQHARKAQFDAVITDQQMPEMTGVELCWRLRALPNYADVPLIMLTAKGLEMQLPQLRVELNISAMFSKPFSPTRVVQTVGELLASTTCST